MLDTMTLTKTFGALFGAFLLYLLAHWGAETVYHIGAGHGKESHGVAEALALEFIEENAGRDEGTEAVDFAVLLEAADPGKGAKVFAKCKACHALEDGKNGTGPHLHQLFSRAIASVTGFGYSSAMADLEGIWDVEKMNAFVENPKAFLPGTNMTFAGLKREKDRANLISYLLTLE